VHNPAFGWYNQLEGEDSVKITQEGLAQRQAVLTIELEPPDLEKYLQRGYQRLVQRVRVPGFRAGKAPRAVLERMVGQEAFLEEAMEVLVPEATDQAVQDQHLEAWSAPEVEVVSRAPLVLKATVPLRPGVELADYRSLRVDAPVVVVEPQKVDEALESLRREVTPWEPVVRPVQMDDLVVMDVTASVEGESILKETDSSYLVAPGSVFPPPGFWDALVGMQRGESRDFTLPLPEEFEPKRLAGKPCRFTVTAKEVKARRLPPLDDEFAKGVGQGFESLDALRGDLWTRLGEAQGREARWAHQDNVVAKVLEGARVELAPLLVEREIDHLLEDITRRAQAAGGGREDAEAYMATLGKTIEEIRTQLQPQALERLQRAAVLAEIADREGVAVSEEALEGEIRRMVQEAGAGGASVRRMVDQPGNREAIARALRTRRTIERLAEIAQGPGDTAAPAVESARQVGAPEEGAEAPTGGLPA
jgi:trigger factor